MSRRRPPAAPRPALPVPASTRLEKVCQGAGWAESTPFGCLGFTWSLRSNNPPLVDHVTELYAACATQRRVAHRFVLRERGSGTEPQATLYRDGRAVLRNVPRSLAVARLVWEVNQGVVEETAERLLLHAAGAEHDDGVVLLSGPQGAGKSTLVAALVAAGLGYVTDETIAVNPADTTIEPYPKPIALDRGSWALLPPLRPEIDPTWAADPWLVAPQSIRTDAVAPAGCTPALVLFPAHRPGGDSSVREIRRADAALRLAEHSFNFRTFGRGALDIVADIVRGSSCFEFDIDDLDAACRVVLELLDSKEVDT